MQELAPSFNEILLNFYVNEIVERLFATFCANSEKRTIFRFHQFMETLRKTRTMRLKKYMLAHYTP